MRRSFPALALILFSGTSALVACEHAEFSLPSGHPEGETPAAGAMDPAKVPGSVVFLRAPGEKAAFVPFACFDRQKHAVLAGEACAAIPIPAGAPLNCVGGGSAPLGRATRVACGGEGTATWPAYEAPGLSCDLATWGDAPPLPEVIELPSIEPQVTREERATLEELLHASLSTPLELRQAITLDLNHDGVRDRVFTALHGMVVQAGAPPGATPLGAGPPKAAIVDQAPGMDYRVLAVTDLDHDLVPELWVARGAESLVRGIGPGVDLSLDHVTPKGTSSTYGFLRCPAVASPPAAPAAPDPADAGRAPTDGGT